MTISKKVSDISYIGIIPSTILKYALTKKYIIAKQKDYDVIHGFGSNNNYYVIEIYSEKLTKLSVKDFEKFKTERKIKNSDWRTP